MKFLTRRASSPILQSKRLWVNTENGNVCRIYNIGDFHFRQSPERRHDAPISQGLMPRWSDPRAQWPRDYRSRRECWFRAEC